MTVMRIAGLLLMSSLLISGCVSQRYAGVQITSTEPMSLTRVMVNGNAVVVCRFDDERALR